MAKRIFFALLILALSVALAEAKITNTEFDDTVTVTQMSGKGFELEYLLQRGTKLQVQIEMKGQLPPGILPVYLRIYDSKGKEVGRSGQPVILNSKKTEIAYPNNKLPAETLKVRLETYNGKSGPGTAILKVTTTR